MQKKTGFIQTVRRYFSDSSISPIFINEASQGPLVICNTEKKIEKQTKQDNMFQIDTERGDQEQQQIEPQQIEPQIQQEYKILDLVKVRQIGKAIDQPYVKKQTINFPKISTFNIVKPIKRHKSLMDYLSSETKRQIALDGGYLYILQETGRDKFLVSSVTSLAELQRILINLGESKPTIRLIFQNKEIKRFYLTEEDNERLFFLKLKKECIKHGHDFIY